MILESMQEAKLQHEACQIVSIEPTFEKLDDGLPETSILAPENRWLTDDRFLFFKTASWQVKC